MLETEILDSLVKPLVESGIYKDETSALKDIILDYINRKREEYAAIISHFQKKYKADFDAFTKDIENSATLQAEDDWMEWKGAIEMRKSWEEAYHISIHGKAKAV